MKINSTADSEQMQLGMFHQEQIEQQLIESHNAPTIVRSNSSSTHGSIAIQRELPVSAAKAAKVQRVSLPHPILNTARIEGATASGGLSGTSQEQRSLFKTLLIRQQQQRESARSHFKVSKPVKPEVADAFEGDTYLAESMSCEAERISYNAIAMEKVASPSIIRNKHIKTMTQLLVGNP